MRSYYRHKDFCVITPYDAQRAALEKQLKAEGLPWERVFNVDSFQGQYIPLMIYSMADSNTMHQETKQIMLSSLLHVRQVLVSYPRRTE